jgi:hypothetical protein
LLEKRCKFYKLTFFFKTEKANPPTPFGEGGALMDPSSPKRGWGDL